MSVSLEDVNDAVADRRWGSFVWSFAAVHKHLTSSDGWCHLGLRRRWLMSRTWRKLADGSGMLGIGKIRLSYVALFLCVLIQTINAKV